MRECSSSVLPWKYNYCRSWYATINKPQWTREPGERGGEIILVSKSWAKSRGGRTTNDLCGHHLVHHQSRRCLLYTKKCYRCYGRVTLLWIPTTTDSTKRYKSYFPEFDNSFSSINLNAKPTWVLSIQLNGYKKGPSAPVSLRIHRTGGTDHPIERIEFQMRNNGDVFDGFTTVVVIFFSFDQKKMEPLIPEDHLFPLVEMCKICPGPWHWQCPGDQCIFINKC